MNNSQARARTVIREINSNFEHLLHILQTLNDAK